MKNTRSQLVKQIKAYSQSRVVLPTASEVATALGISKPYVYMLIDGQYEDMGVAYKVKPLKAKSVCQHCGVEVTKGGDRCRACYNKSRVTKAITCIDCGDDIVNRRSTRRCQKCHLSWIRAMKE